LAVSLVQAAHQLLAQSQHQAVAVAVVLKVTVAPIQTLQPLFVAVAVAAARKIQRQARPQVAQELSLAAHLLM
jgi:hypothetical protein